MVDHGMSHGDHGSMDHRSVHYSSTTMVHYLVALSDSSLWNMVHLMDWHHTDGVHWMDVSSTVTDHLVGLGDGSLGVNDRDGVDGLNWVQDVGASMVHDLAALGEGRLARYGVDDVGFLSQEVGWSGGSAGQDSADDDLWK